MMFLTTLNLSFVGANHIAFKPETIRIIFRGFRPHYLRGAQKQVGRAKMDQGQTTITRIKFSPTKR